MVACRLGWRRIGAAVALGSRPAPNRLLPMRCRWWVSAQWEEITWGAGVPCLILPPVARALGVLLAGLASFS